MILSAARALAERDGIEAVSLSAVARETKIARAAIYSHFTSRQDLISALSLGEPTTEPAQDHEAGPAGMEAESIEPVSPAVDVPAASEDAPQPDGEYDALMRAQAQALQQLTQQVIVPKPKQRDANDAALTRLEARLSVAEQSVAALDQRVGERIKKLDVETGALASTLQDLRTRIEKMEERQQTALAELRLEIHNLQHRDEGGSALVADEPSPEPSAPVITPEPAVEMVTVANPPEENEPGRIADYLSSARQAAIKAATQTAAPPHKKSKSPLIRKLLRKRWTMVAIAAVFVAWFDFYVFAHYQPAQGGPAMVAAVSTPSRTETRTTLTPKAQLARGLKYLNGTGVPVNVTRAKRWLERAALEGEPVAQNLMGVLYQTGTGVTADVPTAIRWYAKSAARGNLKAMTNLGKLYAGGWSEGTDFVKAAGWFTKAAAYGEVDAQFDLAILYERGLGVSRSTTDAYKWYSIAARSGDSHAADRAAMLAVRLSTDELQAADAAAVSFRPLPVSSAANDIPAGKV